MSGAILVEDGKTIKISKALRRILGKAQTPKEFEDWCVSVKLLQPMDIAMIAKMRERSRKRSSRHVNLQVRV